MVTGIIAGLVLAAQSRVLVYECAPQSVGQVVREIGAQENLAISADPEFDDEWMVMRSQTIDRDQILTELAESVGASWVQEENRLILRRTSESRLQEAKRIGDYAIQNLSNRNPTIHHPEFLDLSEEEIKSAIQDVRDGVHPERFASWTPEREILTTALESVNYSEFFMMNEPYVVFSKLGIGLSVPAPPRLISVVNRVKRLHDLSTRVCEQLGIEPAGNPFRSPNLNENDWRVIVSFDGSYIRASVSRSNSSYIANLSQPLTHPITIAQQLALRNTVPLPLNSVESVFLHSTSPIDKRIEVARQLFAVPSFDPRSLYFRHVALLADSMGATNYMVALDHVPDIFRRYSRSTVPVTTATLWTSLNPSVGKECFWEESLQFLRINPLRSAKYSSRSPSTESIHGLWRAIDDERGLQPIEESVFAMKNEFVHSPFGHPYSLNITGQRPSASNYSGLYGYLNSRAERGSFSEITVDYARLPGWLKETIRIVTVVDNADIQYKDGSGWESLITEANLHLVKVHYWRGKVNTIQFVQPDGDISSYLVNDLQRFREMDQPVHTVQRGNPVREEQITERFYLSFGDKYFGNRYSISYMNGAVPIDPETSAKDIFSPAQWQQFDEYVMRERAFLENINRR